MWMSESQIVASYRDARFPAKQIGILAQLNDCSPRTIKMILMKHGHPSAAAPKHYGNDAVTSEQLCRIRRLRDSGASYRVIAEATGISKRSVRYYLSKFITGGNP